MMGQVQEFETAKPAFDAVFQGSDPLGEEAPVEAAVKWFNATKGYGFVELSEGRGDAFLHLKILRETGRQNSAFRREDLRRRSRRLPRGGGGAGCRDRRRERSRTDTATSSR